MLLKIKFNLFQIFKLIFILLLTNTSNLYSHNFFNGGCEEHCRQKLIEIKNENEPNNVKNQIDIESNNSCLSKSLCRG